MKRVILPARKVNFNIINWMLDSGAFSAWAKGLEINIDDYRAFLERMEGIQEYCVNLDVIPGGFRKLSSSSIVEDAAEQSWKNYQYLRKAGLPVFPVFHQGERLYWLEKMIDSDTDYIGLGGIAAAGSDIRWKWLGSTFSFLCGDRGFPPVKVHGFGMTGIPMYMAFPWYSVDSTSWVYQAGMGKVWIPHKNSEGDYDYQRSPRTVDISERKGKPRENEPFSTVTMGPEVEKYLREYIDRAQINMANIRGPRDFRVRLNLSYVQRVVKNHIPTSYQGDNTFFSSSLKTNKVYKPKRSRIYLGVSSHDQEWESLYLAEGWDRILSYFYAKDLSPETFRAFTESGRSNGKVTD